jgi:hypothetical protein
MMGIARFSTRKSPASHEAGLFVALAREVGVHESAVTLDMPHGVAWL